MTGRHAILLFLLPFSALPSFAADDAAVTVASRVSKSKITIGDTIRYTVTVTHPKGVTVKTPGTGANLGGFFVSAYRVADPVEKKGIVVSETDYTLATFVTGEFVIPPLPVAYQAAGDTAIRVIASPSIKITVESVKPSEAGDIREVKPPLDIPLDVWRLLARIGIGLLALAAAIAGWILYRRWKSGKGILPVRQEPPRPPHEIALEALDRLAASDLLDRGEIKAYYIELSEIVRRYVGGRYFVVAMEMTTTEVLDGLGGAGVTGEPYALFESLFTRCDLVKFAKLIPSAAETDGALKTAIEIVQRTKVVLEPEPAAATETASEPTEAGAPPASAG
jgi:hypothetical protein